MSENNATTNVDEIKVGEELPRAGGGCCAGGQCDCGRDGARHQQGAHDHAGSQEGGCGCGRGEGQQTGCQCDGTGSCGCTDGRCSCGAANCRCCRETDDAAHPDGGCCGGNARH